MLKVHSIESFGTHEGPGIRLVIFLQGCNFKCLYCHNPDSISAQGEKLISVKTIINLLKEQAPYFSNGGGLTVSGGEPGLQSKELIKLFKEVKENGFNVALDTNASIISDDFKKVLDLSDLALIDLKHINNEQHLKLCGQENKNVLSNIEYREKSKKTFWIRYVLVPGWTDNREHLEELGKYLAKFKYLERLEILPYHNLGAYKYRELRMDYHLSDNPLPSNDDLSLAVKILNKYLKNVIIRS